LIGNGCAWGNAFGYRKYCAIETAAPIEKRRGSYRDVTSKGIKSSKDGITKIKNAI
jgi:hypothetical protein